MDFCNALSSTGLATELERNGLSAGSVGSLRHAWVEKGVTSEVKFNDNVTCNRVSCSSKIIVCH